MRLKPLALFFMLSTGAWAQTLGYGIKLGVPFTDVYSNGISENSRFVIGPMVEFRLPIVSIEADALFHYVSLKSTTTSTAGSPSSGSTWQLPIVGKVRLPATPILKPYGDAGIAFRTFTGGGSGLGSPPKKGFVLGAGLDIHAIVLHITPELRFTHWGTGQSVFVQTNGNQFEFLVGFSR